MVHAAAQQRARPHGRVSRLRRPRASVQPHRTCVSQRALFLEPNTVDDFVSYFHRKACPPQHPNHKQSPPTQRPPHWPVPHVHAAQVAVEVYGRSGSPLHPPPNVYSANPLARQLPQLFLYRFPYSETRIRFVQHCGVLRAAVTQHVARHVVPVFSQT